MFVRECPDPPADVNASSGSARTFSNANSACPRVARTAYNSTAHPSLTHAEVDSQLSENEGYNCRSHWSVSRLSAMGVRGKSWIPYAKYGADLGEAEHYELEH